MSRAGSGTSQSAMRSDRALRCLGVAAALLLGHGAAAQDLVDRVVAVVNGQPITLSEAVETVALQPHVEPAPTLAEAVETLIEARLMETEARRYPMGPVPADEIEATLRALRDRFASDAAYRAALLRLGIREDYLRKRIERELAVDRYIERRFRPLVRVSQREIEDYYRTTLLPDLDDAAATPPPEVTRLIRRTLEERQLHQRVNDWVDGIASESAILRLALPDEQDGR